MSLRCRQSERRRGSGLVCCFSVFGQITSVPALTSMHFESASNSDVLRKLTWPKTEKQHTKPDPLSVHTFTGVQMGDATVSADGTPELRGEVPVGG